MGESITVHGTLENLPDEKPKKKRCKTQDRPTVLAEGRVPGVPKRQHKKARACRRVKGGGRQTASPAVEAETPPCVQHFPSNHDLAPLDSDVQEFLQGPSLVTWLRDCLAEEPDSLLAEEAFILADIKAEQDYVAGLFASAPQSPPPLF